MKLLVDSRETWFPHGCKTQLDIGDFVICDEDDCVVLIFERKTIQDLASSVVDGRFKEQKQRMLATVKDPKSICYIIEGVDNPRNLCSSISLGTLLQIADNLQLREGFTVFYSENKEHTQTIIHKVFEKVSLDPEAYTSSVSKDYLSCVKVKKSKNVSDPRSCAILQLSTIPRVTPTIANVILDAYECCSMNDLLRKIENKNEFVKRVSKIKIKDRAIGPKCAQTICDSMGII